MVQTRAPRQRQARISKKASSSRAVREPLMAIAAPKRAAATAVHGLARTQWRDVAMVPKTAKPMAHRVEYWLRWRRLPNASPRPAELTKGVKGPSILKN